MPPQLSPHSHASEAARALAYAPGAHASPGPRGVDVIETLLRQAGANALKIQAVNYLDVKGERRPAYELDRDSFTLLAMGFTEAAAHRQRRRLRREQERTGKPRRQAQREPKRVYGATS